MFPEHTTVTVIVAFTVDAEETTFTQPLMATDTRIELTQFVPVNDAFIPYFWKQRNGDTEAFEQHARSHPAVASLENLDGRVDTALYRIEWTDKANGFLDALRQNDVLVEAASTTHGEEWRFRLRAFDQNELSAFQTACFEDDIHIDIQRMVHNPDSDSGDRPAFLSVSDKQREALELALEHGYFAVPRENSATELAKEIGISRSAFSRRLQRAQETVFTNLFHSGQV